MAFTTFEKDCLRDCSRVLVRKRDRRRATAAELDDLDIIETGDETDKKALVLRWIEDRVLPGTEELIDDIGQLTLDQEAKKIELEAYVAANS